MIVVSLDPVGETVSMISIPRDMVDVPLPDGRRFRGKINSLVSYARHHPKEFPGSDGSGDDVLMGALGQLVGLQIDHFAQVNLGGFVRVVDTLGGVDVDVADAFCDPTYDEYGFSRGFAISVGRHHLNGNQALAFARVRKAAGRATSPGPPAAGGPVGDPRRGQARRLPARSDRADEGAVEDRRDEPATRPGPEPGGRGEPGRGGARPIGP
jgi:LCP family protein required for cell wall assembly